MVYKYIYLVRHAETYDNKNRTFSGWRDSRLTPAGIRHARNHLAKKLKNKKIGLAFSSDQSRAVDTARIILKNHPGVRLIKDRRLRERSYGKLQGKNKDKFAEEHSELWPKYHRSWKTRPPGGESIEMVVKRVEPFIRELIKRMKRDKINILISAHGNSIRPFRKHFEHLSPAQTVRVENPHERVWAFRVRV